MSDEIELLSDGNGFAVIGSPTAVERFLASEGLASTDLGLARLGGAARAGSVAAQAGAEVAANSGRWVQLTKESAEAVKKYGLMDTKTPGVKHAMVGKPGDIKQWIQIVKTPGSMLTNPAMLAGAAGIMTQFALQQQMDAITDYLAIIDEKLDDVLRAQTNQVLARMAGVEMAIREATKIRDSVGRVSEVTWSKVQSSSTAVLETQGYALLQLRDLADKIENKAKLDELTEVAEKAAADVQQWLIVLARCFQLQDAIAVLELDRVLDAAPDELDRHRVGLLAARDDRLEAISDGTNLLMERLNAAAHTANMKVLLHPSKAPRIVESGSRVALGVHGLHEVLGIEAGREAVEARRWKEAAGDSWDKVRETGEGGLDTAKRFGNEASSRARTAKDKLVGKIPGRRFRRGEDDLPSEHVG
jgi:hypothetical protein